MLQGALCGIVTSLGMGLWLGIGSILYRDPDPVLPLSVQCLANLSQASTMLDNSHMRILSAAGEAEQPG